MQEEITFGGWLRKQRRALDLSRRAFADQVGCAEVTLRRIETDTLKPSKELANVLLEKLGIAEAERSQWISFARGSSSFPTQSIPSSNKPQSNLPASLTSFVGREKEQAEVIGLLAKHRLVTLTGSGGVGKTRLAVTVGEQVLENYEDGVWLVELTSLNDPLLLPWTVATALGLVTQSDISSLDLLINFLRSKSTLLIVDNCEHLVDACAHLADALLKNCAHLKILVTSREPLETTGEALYRVPSLRLPGPEYQLDTLREIESVKLFEERAQLVQFDFSLTPNNIVSVVQICQRLDGIPLAIELAAAKVALLSTEQIAEQLQDSFNLLTEGSRTALPRHQTLRASITWSWNLLTESEQRLMRQLSVFAGGWTLDAAQSVCMGDILYLLNSLVAKSLIVLNQRPENNPRYYFHETIRQYAHEKLLEAEGDATLRDQHLAYFVILAEQAEPELYRSNQVFWLSKLDEDRDNFRRALEWALNTDAKSGLRLMVALRFFWEAHGDFEEVRSWLAPLLERYSNEDSLRIRALVIYSRTLAERGDLIEAQKIVSQSLDLAREISDRQAEAFSLWGLGVTISLQGDLRKSTSILEQSLALYRSMGDQFGQATVMNWLTLHNEDLESSKTYLLESLRIYRELGHLSGVAMCLADLANGAIYAGDFSSAVQWMEEALIIFRKLGSQSGQSWMLWLYGRLAYWQGDYKKAQDYFEDFAKSQEKAGILFNIPWSGVYLAYIVLRRGDYWQANEMLSLSIQQFQRENIITGVIFAVEGIASLHANRGQPERAVRLFAWADAMREQIDDHRPPVEQKSVGQDLAAIHVTLNEEEFTKFSEEGRSMTVEQAIALALERAEEMNDGEQS